jgi:hypothetical protein
MPTTPFTIPGPPAASPPGPAFLAGAATVTAANFRPYLLPGYVHAGGTYGADLFAAVPVYVPAHRNRSMVDYTSADVDVRTWLGYSRPWVRQQCEFCHTVPAAWAVVCAARVSGGNHRPALQGCLHTDPGAVQMDYWAAACGSFACLGRTAVPGVLAPLELCDAILQRHHTQHYPLGVNNSGPADGDLNLGTGANIDHARLVTLQGLLETAIGEMIALTAWSADRRAFHHAMLRLQLDLYGFTTAPGALGVGDIGIATHASNWYSFDHFGIKALVATASGNVTVFTQKVTDSPVSFFCNSLWDEAYEETVVKVTHIPARLAWVLSRMTP